MPKIGAPPAPDYSYQEDGIRWLGQLPEGRGLLADEPGLGKSRQLLLAAEGRTLVLAPGMVLEGGVWTDEVAKWRPELDVTFCPYTYLNAREKTGANASATRPTEEIRPEFRKHWDTVILDESHYIKGRKTSWTQAILKLEAGQIFCATGTPIPNWAYELFTTLQLLHPNESKTGQRFGSYWRWAKQWFDVGATRYSPMDVGDPLDDSPEGWERFYQENLGGLFLQRFRDDVLKDLPPIVGGGPQIVKCRMRPEQAKIYKALKKDYIAWTEDNQEVVAWSSGGLHVKLQKICQGVEVELPGSKPCSGKLDQFEMRVADQARPSLVACNFKDMARAAFDRCVKVGRSPVLITGDTSSRDRSRAIEGYKAGDFDVLVATIETVSEGHTFTHADTVHRLERSYRPFKNEQVMRRVHRIGQTRPVTVLDYVTEGTVDEGMLPKIKAKTDHQVKVLPAREYAALL